jgi:hypothetical protein
MKKEISGQVPTPSGPPPKAMKCGKRALMLPIPAAVRQRRKLELWRDRIWQSRRKFIVLLDPQSRELVRKIGFTMDKARLSWMVDHLHVGLFSIWFFTGSVQKMEELILGIIKGRVFLMNSLRLILPLDARADLPKLELIKRLLLYDPTCYPAGCSVDVALQATPLLRFLAAPPELKPWIRQWISEMQETQRQTTAEIGKESADALWAEVRGIKTPCNPDLDAKYKNQRAEEKVSYW